MIVKILAAVLALLYLGNGAFMLWDPAVWYGSVPNIAATGPMNPHFIRDIGFIYALSGLAFVLAIARSHERALWAAAGAAWPTLHALFHLSEWAGHGLPPRDALVAEALGVVLPAILGVVVAIAARRAPIS